MVIRCMQTHCIGSAPLSLLEDSQHPLEVECKHDRFLYNAEQ